MINSEYLKSLVIEGESQRLELKTTFTKEAIETLAAFANAGGGYLVVGVTDRKQVVGVEMGAETIQNWVNQVKTATAPQLIPQTEILMLDEKQVVLFTVSESLVKPISVKGRYLKRANNANHVLSLVEIADLHLQTRNLSWDAYVSDRYALADISIEKVNRAIRMINQHRPYPIEDDALMVLAKYELLQGDHISNACFFYCLWLNPLGLPPSMLGVFLMPQRSKIV